ncbi:TPA: hypothetical protein ACXJXD_000042 [Pseudomonas aeruginosa]
MGDAKIGQMMNRIALGGLAEAYAHFFAHCGDHSQAMQMTCKTAIRAGYKPCACRVSAAALAARQHTNSVAFTKGASPSYLIIVAGRVGIDYELDNMFSSTIGTPDWKLIEGKAADQYQAWGFSRKTGDIGYKYRPKATLLIFGLNGRLMRSEVTKRYTAGPPSCQTPQL